MATSQDRAQGIDVSHYQGNVNWAQVRGAGCSFAFCKATEGLHTADAMFATNWPAIPVAGLIRGAYHFFHPEEDAASQAAFFLSTLAAAGGLTAYDLPPVLDVEITGGVASSAIWSGAATWLEAVEDETGRTPLLYTSTAFWDGNAADPTLTRYPLWLADYAATPTVPTEYAGWTFWQYSQSGSIAGVTGAVDLDVFAGSAVELLSYLASNTAPAAS